MPKRKRKANSRELALAKSIRLLISEVRIGNQEFQAKLSAMRDELRINFDRLNRHIDGFIKRHEREVSFGD